MTETTETKTALRWPELWLWVDVETTGLDEDRDTLLEIAARATVPTKEGTLEEVGDPFNTVLGWGEEHINGLRENAEPVVRDMHDMSGLWLASANAERGGTHKRWSAWLRSVVALAGDVYLAGRNVHFDRRWLEAWSYRLDGVSHRHVDVTTLPRVGATMGLKPPRFSIPHRALADVDQEIEEMRWWLRALRGGVV